MVNKILFCFVIAITMAVSVNARANNDASAVYILQIASDLGCDALTINLHQENAERKVLTFTNSAFGFAEIPPGKYTFGDVVCKQDESSETYTVLRDKIQPFSLDAGMAYYGGRMIFKQSTSVDNNSAPDVLEECTRVMSRARGDDDDECRNGVGVDTRSKRVRQVELFLPEVSRQDIKVVRDALKAGEDQLQYLPLNLS